MFTLDKNKTPRHWSPREDIPTLAHTARLAAAGVLAQLAVLRRPKGTGGDAAEAQRQEAAIAAVEEGVLKLARNDLQQQQQQEAGTARSGSSSSDRGARRSSKALPSSELTPCAPVIPFRVNPDMIDNVIKM